VHRYTMPDPVVDPVVIRLFSAPTTTGAEVFSVGFDGAVRDKNGKIAGTIVAGIWPDSPFSPQCVVLFFGKDQPYAPLSRE